ncbi:Gfo/Idh/MocA family oxidoreductase [Francisella philomiragia]|uniref:Gfo/Idh/MocA family oxidoreductase n=1 Tax=Francisella philomiragia TaxID=28110 RepID=UPI0035162B7D
MIKIGIVGFSSGNGHPYSWSAIFNGYDKHKIHDCGFPVIADYLSKRSLPEECIFGAKVTHIWTEDYDLSKKIATVSLIDNVSLNIENLISSVDAVLIARDDCSELRENICYKVLDAGLPVFIDKPIALSLSQLERLYSKQRYEGQIFSCSAFKYSAQFNISQGVTAKLGKIRLINSIIPKSWDKYAVHLIDPIVQRYASSDSINSVSEFGNKTSAIVGVSVVWNSDLVTNFLTIGDLSSPAKVDIIGESGNEMIILDDAFGAFKSSLEVFVYRVRAASFVDEYEHHQKVVSIIEKGMK